MDWSACRLANALVGNALDAAALEVTLVGPELRFEKPSVFAVTGADLSASLDGAPSHSSRRRRVPVAACCVSANAGQARARTSPSTAASTCRACSAAAQRTSSADLVVIDGRALVAGDRLPLGETQGTRDSRTQQGRARSL